MKIKLIVTLSFLVLYHSILPSQTPEQSQQLRKVALVIGNGNYISSILANPENDAKSMADILRKLGFTVLEYENLNSSRMKKAIDDFGLILKGFEVSLFYYAGHGIQAKGYNYLIPIDAELRSEEQVEYDCVRADRVLALMETSGTSVNIVILDACRNNPFERSWTRSATGKGLAYMNAPKGTLIAYATAPGSTASDGSGKNGLYTSALLDNIMIPNISIEQLFKNVRNNVSLKSSNLQTPWESTSLTGDFYFLRKSLSDSANINVSTNSPGPFVTDLQIDDLFGKVKTVIIRNSIETPNRDGEYQHTKMPGKIISNYNINGFLTQTEEYSPDGNLIEKVTMKYNGDTLSSEEYFEPKENKKYTIKIKIVSYCQREELNLESGELNKVTYALENGKVVKRTVESKHGIIYNQFYYNIYGHWAKSTLTATNKPPDFNFTFYHTILEIDKNNNWTRSQSYEPSYKESGVKYQTREIIYY